MRLPLARPAGRLASADEKPSWDRLQDPVNQFSASKMKVIKPLTSLRFFAALMVLASHYWKFEAGFSGVTFFYVLSGYVLAINYAGKLVTQGDRRLFWWKRFARIYCLSIKLLTIKL